MNTQLLIERIDHCIAKGEYALSTKFDNPNRGTLVDPAAHAAFRASSLSLIAAIYGDESVYFTEFKKLVDGQQAISIRTGMSLLASIKSEVENGWLSSLRALVTAEVFSDFMEMGKYFLDEGYKDAAAVMIGSTLEEHLRQLCVAHNVDTHYINKGDNTPKKANLINSDLRKADVYSSLEEKQVIAWLGLRNCAAHGEYDKYSTEQVAHMYQGVLDFMARVK